MIRRVKPKRVIEVGSLVGYSAIAMGKELESEAEIIAFEIEENEANLARESIRSSCVRPRVELLMAMPWDLFLSFREAD